MEYRSYPFTPSGQRIDATGPGFIGTRRMPVLRGLKVDGPDVDGDADEQIDHSTDTCGDDDYRDPEDPACVDPIDPPDLPDCDDRGNGNQTIDGISEGVSGVREKILLEPGTDVPLDPENDPVDGTDALGGGVPWQQQGPSATPKPWVTPFTGAAPED